MNNLGTQAFLCATASEMSLTSGSEVYDVIVVGAGVEGSATAYHLASRPGKKILLLEQFSALHTRGSSHGLSRITRRAYYQPYYVHMMDEAYRIWSQLEKEAEKQLYIPTGILWCEPSSGSKVDSVIASLRSNGVEYEILTAEEVNSKYSKQLNLPLDYKCMFEKDGGILLANVAVATYQQLYCKRGGVLLDNHMVTEIRPGSIITVVTNKRTFRARKLVLTTGAWTRGLSKALHLELPFEVVRGEVLYWSVDKPEDFSAQNFPATAFEPQVPGTDDRVFHSIPMHEYHGLMKVMFRHGLSVDPDHRDANTKQATTALVSEFIRKFFKGVSDVPSIYESCLYTESPDSNPVIDCHPKYSNIIIGAGFSGHGFKLSPVVGKILCELALDLPPSYDLTPFRVDRFTPPSAAL